MYQDNVQHPASDNSPQAIEDERKPFVTIARTMNGYYYAAYMEWSTVSGSFAILRSGMTRSKKKHKAINEGESWARREHVPFR